jgi:hypothetical protein
MNAKYFIIIGGAIALFYLYQKNKKSITYTAEAKDEVTPLPVIPKPVTPKPVTPKPVTPKPVTPKPVTPKLVTITPAGGTTSGGTTSGGQAIFTGNTTEQALISGGVRPIVKPTRVLSASIF